MTRPAKYTRGQLLERLEAVFKESGYEGASMKMLSEVTGLSKASLYHHFKGGKEDMAAHVLAQSGARLQAHVLGPLLGDGQATEKLLASFRGANRYYDGDVPVCLMNSLLLGDGRKLFAARIEAAVDIWRKGLSACLVEAGALKADADDWADEVLGRVQGALVLCRVRGTRTPLVACLRALEQDVVAWDEADAG